MIFQFDAKVNQIAIDAKNSEDAIRKVGAKLYANGYVKDTYTDAVWAREKVFPTGLPFKRCGIALPHTDIEHVNKPIIAVATLKNPVTFQNMGDASESVEVEMIVMLAMKNSEFQLTLLSRLIDTLQDVDFVSEMLKATTPEELAEKMSARINEK